ncbi:hypothetical protein pdul_cds_552 [Pandoravirus dulcis]|uniref:Uncharacterized protein n=1 Tax=Pandoravirus dulcis TaxID=1349409 RepID=S4VQV7_9VIRU|nr:hypothetical protein pdul_cds_552 [Pandoravirus dulcis]AGO82662.2 hypothetical protein pdul_cds_552 [Pandoravirus dulcis]
MDRCLCTVRGCFYTCLSLANVAACLAFLAFAVECTLVHGEPVETCYDSFLAYREVNKAMLGLLYGLQIVCSLLLLWLCRGVSVGPWRHVRRTLADPGARLYEAAMWSATGAMVAYVWWALGSEGVYAMAALITTGVLTNTATTSYIAPVDLSERPSVGAGRPRPALSGVGPGVDVEAGLHAIEAGSSSYYDYSDDDAFYDEYADDEPVLVAAGAIAASAVPSVTTTRPRPGRMRSAAMRTLLLNLFLHNAVLFLYDVTSVLARLEDAESAPLVRRALVLSNLASVWYRAGQALFHYRKYNFAWRNVMIPQFEAAPITAR